MQLITDIKEYLKSHELPGEEAHALLSPMHRVSTKNAQRLKNFNPRRAAVLVLLFPKGDELHNVLIQRSEYAGTHSRQIAFPGGKVEARDESYEIAALREAEEEVGVPAQAVEVLGAMTEVYIPPSNFLVHPFIGYLPFEPEFIPQKEEVDEILTYNITELYESTVIKQTKIELSSGVQLKAPYMDLCNKVVWGATGVMLSEFRQLLLNLRD